MIQLRINNESFLYDAYGLVQAFYPGEKPKVVPAWEEPCDEADMAAWSKDKDCIGLHVGSDAIRFYMDGTEQGSLEIDPSDRSDTKNRLKRLIYNILSKRLGKELPWGTLTGIRPTKIALKKLQAGESREDVASYMRQTYLTGEEKIQLSCDIAQRELRIIGDSQGKYSLYIGIPFCPSICLYCSFSSYPIGLYRNMVQEYVAAVKKEIAFVGEHFADKTLDTVYFGGGTPTSVSAEALDEIITALEEHVDLSHLREFTVEAGRPDSITEEKLRVLLKHHVGRISINPQTMQQKTLDLIGRFHTVEQIRKTYALARCLSDEDIAAGGKGFLINMDLIVGLPGESIEDVRDTLAQIEAMKPDNLTVHSLAIKRSARLNIEWEKYENILQSANHNIMDEVMASARRMGMEPYYLYRQKQISGNLENIGFAREGDEGIYNILIMEEQEDIVALGAGSACKKILRNPDGSIATDKKVERCENVKDVEQYIARVDEMIARKKELYV